MMVDVRPWPKAFRPPQAEASTGAAGGDAQPPAAQPRCFYFMGLSKKRAQVYSQYNQAMIIPQSKVDLTGPVNEFAHKVKEFEQRREGMDISVRHLLQRQLPEWVRPAPANGNLAPAEAEAAPAANGGAAVDAAPALDGKPQLIGSKRSSAQEEAEGAAGAAKRQQMGSPSAGEAAAASSQDGAQPASRGNSDIQMADLQEQQADGQEVDPRTTRCCCAAAELTTGVLHVASVHAVPAERTNHAQRCNRCLGLACPPLPPAAPQAPPETAAGAAETAEERHTASDEAQLASVGDVGEWTVLHHQAPASGTAAPVAAAKKQIAVMCVARAGWAAHGGDLQPASLLWKHQGSLGSAS
jgi:hypothetical protein